MIKISLK